MSYAFYYYIIMDVGVSRTLSYLQCIHLVQDHLNSLPHGSLIKWCEEHDLTYRTVIRVKTNRLDFFAPNLIADLLRAMGYEVWQTKVPLADKKKDKDKETRKKETLYIVKKLPNPSAGSQTAEATGPARS